jgi:hypothetical protein
MKISKKAWSQNRPWTTLVDAVDVSNPRPTPTDGVHHAGVPDVKVDSEGLTIYTGPHTVAGVPDLFELGFSRDDVNGLHLRMNPELAPLLQVLYRDPGKLVAIYRLLGIVHRPIGPIADAAE